MEERQTINAPLRLSTAFMYVPRAVPHSGFLAAWRNQRHGQKRDVVYGKEDGVPRIKFRGNRSYTMLSTDL